MTKNFAPFGTWHSSISAEMVAGKSPKLSEPLLESNRVFWLESKPEEKGRTTIMMHESGQSQSILPRPLSAKSKVHEYGGGSFAISGDYVFFVLADDQQIYKLDFTQDTIEPVALTQQVELRFSDIQFDQHRNKLIAVCEDHSPITKDGKEPSNYLVAIPVDGSKNITILHEGFDFYSFPRISPNGEHLCWTCWNHPDMPWDKTELWLAQLTQDGTLASPGKIAGNKPESIFQPNWSPDNTLYFVSDRDNWWNIYTYEQNKINQITHEEAEFATPQWTFNMSTYGFIDEHTIAATFTKNGTWHFALINTKSGALKIVDQGSTYIEGVNCRDGKTVFIGASPTSSSAIYYYDSPTGMPKSVNSQATSIDIEDISVGQPVSFTSENDETVHGFYYPPKNREYNSNAKPPLITLGHGGPTGATANSLNLKIQYWTNRGFAILDVNYRGSTGYGRQYRHTLYKNWGIYDVEDLCNFAESASKNDLCDPDQLIVKGSSAGGYTTLAALTFKKTFNCGVSLYGIGDLETLARDTHKFESRYMDKLIGPYPEEKHAYISRSPVHSVDRIACPLLIFQGLEDKVVPPNQANAMFNAVKENGLPVSMVTFENEGHGFRQAENICAMLDSELEFYLRVFKVSNQASTTLKIHNI